MLGQHLKVIIPMFTMVEAFSGLFDVLETFQEIEHQITDLLSSKLDRPLSASFQL